MSPLTRTRSRSFFRQFLDSRENEKMSVRTFTDDNWASVMHSRKPVLVDFYATWCAPCQAMLGQLGKLDEEVTGIGHVGKLDVDANRATASKYNVSSLPTLILFRHGEPVQRWVGVQSVDVLADAMKTTATTSQWPNSKEKAMSDAERIAELEAENKRLRDTLCRIRCTLEKCCNACVDCECTDTVCGTVERPND